MPFLAPIVFQQGMYYFNNCLLIVNCEADRCVNVVDKARSNVHESSHMD